MNTNLCGLLTLVTACLPAPGTAVAASREYDSKAEHQSISGTLIASSQRADLQIGHLPEGLGQNVLVGSIERRHAADSIMNQGDLSAEQQDEQATTIDATAKRRSVEPSDENITAVSRRQSVRLAQVHESAMSEAEQESYASNKSESAKRREKMKLNELEEVVVTAQKRLERLQDVPISISVLSGEDLDSSTITDVTEALSRVPGVAIIEAPFGGVAQIPVRGVAAAATFDTGSSPTAYYLDGVPFGSASEAFGPDPDAYDLERVEVLRGPQGTLYGANALNGVVRILTNEANVSEFEIKGRALTSSTEKGGENYRGDVAVNVPIIDGKLAARVALGYQDLSGWIDRPNNRDANDTERRTMRLKIGAQPNDSLSIGLSAWSSRADYGAPPMGFDARHNSTLIDEPIATDYDVYGFKIGYDDSKFSLTSMTSYLDYKTAFRSDVGFAYDGIVDARTFAQEIYLASTSAGAWRWSAGGMYRDSEDRDIAYLPELTSTVNVLRNVSKSYAAFGEVTRLFLEGQWELTAGLRYFEDELTQKEDSRFVFGDETVELFDSVSTFNATTPRLVLGWHPSKQHTVYASYSEGFRSGFHQNPLVLAVAPFPAVEPDELRNYELGAKGNLWSGRFNFDAALYFMDWRGVQQVILVPIREGISQAAGVNSESVSGVGFDVAVTFAPVDRLELGANLSWNDLSMDADVLSGGALLFREGDRPANSIEYTVGASMDYVFPLGIQDLEGRFSASANYTSALVARYIVGDARALIDADPMLIARTSFSVRSKNHWTASLFVDNLNNEQGIAQILRSPDAVGFYENWLTRVRPRTVGVQIEYGF